MENNVDELIQKMTDFLKTEAKTDTIIGQQFQLGEFTCVPVMSLGMGFGAGGGEGKGNAAGKGEGEGHGSGGGAGMGLGPVGFLVTRGSEIHFIPAHNPKGLSAAIEKIPDVIGKYFDAQKEKEKA